MCIRTVMKMQRSNIIQETDVDDVSIDVEASTDMPNTDENKISNLAAMMHMIKSTIGGGFLAMPEAFHNAGLIVGTIGTVVLGVAVLNMMTFIVHCSQTLRSGKYAAMILADEREDNDTDEKEDNDTDEKEDNDTDEKEDNDTDEKEDNSTDERDQTQPNIQKYSKELLLRPMDYPDTVAAVFKYGARGRFASWAPLAKAFTSFSLILTYYGVNIMYVCLVSEQTKQIVDHYTAGAAVGTWSHRLNGLSLHLYPLAISLLIIPMGMIRLIKYLLPFSVIANALMSAGTAALFYFIFTDDDGHDPLRADEHAKLVVTPIARWTLFAGSALCSMEGVGMLMQIENSMKKPLQLAGPPAYTLHWSMFIIVLLNGTLGFFGYIRYGERSLASLPRNLPSNNSLSEAVKIAITVGILMTYSLQLNVTSDLIWQWLQKNLSKRTVSGNGLKNVVKIKTESSLDYCIMRFLLIIGSIFIATAFPNAGPMISLVGSVGFSILGLIVPVAMETVWYWYPDTDCNDGGEMDGRGMASTTALRHAKNVILVLLALFALIGGAYYNISEIIHMFSGHSIPKPVS